MIADSLTKALTVANHKVFIEMTSLEDQRKRLTFIKMEKGKKTLQHCCEAELVSKAYGYEANAF